MRRELRSVAAAGSGSIDRLWTKCQTHWSRGVCHALRRGAMNRLRLLVLVVALGAAGFVLPQYALGATNAGPVAAQSGSLRLCKVAGAGISAGDPFTFSLTTQTVTRTLTVS